MSNISESEKAKNALEWLKVLDAIRLSAEKSSFTKRGFNKHMKQQINRLREKCHERING